MKTQLMIEKNIELLIIKIVMKHDTIQQAIIKAQHMRKKTCDIN